MSALPQPSEAFEWVQAGAGPALVCRPLAVIAHHLFTTRRWSLGHSPAGLKGPPHSHDGWHEVAAAVGLEPPRIIRARQVHGASVLLAAGGAAPAPAEADIIAARAEDGPLAVAVQSADCIPLLIADRRTRAVVAAHAGWRGLAARVPSAAVAAMTGLGSDPADLVAAIGPSIGACCYEVGADVRARFEDAGFGPEAIARWFHDGAAVSRRNPPMPGLALTRRDGHWFFDGWSSIRDQLVAAGCGADRIYAAGLCTASHPDAFCSYRRDGTHAGRMAGAIRA